MVVLGESATTWMQAASSLPWDGALITAIIGPGFAALVAWYLLTKILPAVAELTRGVDKLQSSVEQGAEKMNDAQNKMQASVDRLNDSVSFLARNTPQQRMGDRDLDAREKK